VDNNLRHTGITASAILFALWITGLGLPAAEGTPAAVAPAAVQAPETGNSRGSQLQALLKRLKDSNVAERQRAAIELGNLGNRQATQPLVEALKDPDEFVRNFAARSLGDLKDPGAVEPLIGALKDENLLVRRSAVESLGNIGDPRALDPLINAMEGGSDIERRAAIVALGKMGGPKVKELLLKALKGDDMYIQDGAADALTEMGQTVVPDLVGLLADWTTGPRVAPILKDLTWQPSSDSEKIWFYVASRNIQSILKEWDTAKKILMESADGEDDAHVQDAVFALIGIGQSDSVATLVSLIDKKGTPAMAAAYINSGNKDLVAAAQSWAAENGADVDPAGQKTMVRWGAMQSS
jgi:hypothetical protein